MVMEKEPVISVIIPVYNIGHFLPTCLESLLAQTFQQYEILCVDDASEDNSVQVVKSYQLQDDRIKLLQQPHTGVSAARNMGICSASGKYILFVDGDDWIEKDMLEKMLKRAEETACDMVVCSAEVHFTYKNFRNIRSRKSLQNALSVRDGFWSAEDSNDDIWSIVENPGVWPFVWNKLIRGDVIRQHKLCFSPELPLGEDGVFVHSLLQQTKKITFLSERFYHYRYQRKDSATVTTAENIATRFCHHINVIDAMFRNFSEENVLEKNGSKLLDWSIRFLYSDFVALPVDARKEVSFKLRALLNKYPTDEFSKELDYITRKRLNNMKQVAVRYTATTRLLRVLQTKIENRILRIQRRKKKRGNV